MKKSKFTHFVFSIYSTALCNYPYYPFVAKTVNEAIHKYIKFITYKDAICEGAELHLIGTCELHPNSTELENLQPYIVPKKVEIKENFLSKLFVLIDCKVVAFERYLKTLSERKSVQNGKTRKY